LRRRLRQHGAADDNKKMAEYGLGDAALPYYVRWIRQDIIGIYYMMSDIRRIAYIGIVRLFVIAFFLFKIAYR
jgi:hypothetical protein